MYLFCFWLFYVVFSRAFRVALHGVLFCSQFCCHMICERSQFDKMSDIFTNSILLSFFLVQDSAMGTLICCLDLKLKLK